MSSFEGGFLTLHAESPLHPGAGTTLGVVDLPVQRERHTQFPTIPGTALKGVLRDRARRNVRKDGDIAAADNDDTIVALFGGPVERASRTPEAGAISISDARLLAFPVRSLKGVFAWVSCRTILERLVRDARIVGVKSGDLTQGLDEERPGDGQALVPKGSPLILNGTVEIGKRVVLEEYDFQATDSTEAETIATFIADKMLPDGDEYRATRERFKRSFCVLHDDDFTYFARHATEILARIALDRKTKTVRGKALFYEELVPAESIFYAVVLAEDARSRVGNGKQESASEGVSLETRSRPAVQKRKAGELIQELQRIAVPDGAVIQVGADEGTGRGLCAVRLARGAAQGGAR